MTPDPCHSLRSNLPIVSELWRSSSHSFGLLQHWLFFSLVFGSHQPFEPLVALCVSSFEVLESWFIWVAFPVPATPPRVASVWTHDRKSQHVYITGTRRAEATEGAQGASRNPITSLPGRCCHTLLSSCESPCWEGCLVRHCADAPTSRRLLLAGRWTGWSMGGTTLVSTSFFVCLDLTMTVHLKIAWCEKSFIFS